MNASCKWVDLLQVSSVRARLYALAERAACWYAVGQEGQRWTDRTWAHASELHVANDVAKMSTVCHGSRARRRETLQYNVRLVDVAVRR